ncbi:hypothetical protein ACJMK2_042462 [Sinanodonta woodiana]|uniref:EF-hand domain-containing protein n=1 Tax=Sinanodonta woodiana TaxID=1069815 RepID=A0ABD3W7F8_SINWO
MGVGLSRRASDLKGRYIHKLRQKVPNMGVDEILEWYREYKTLSRGKNLLTEVEFVELYQYLFPGLSWKLAKHIFRAFDTDRDGTLNFEEFLVGLSMTDLSRDEDSCRRRTRWIFQVYDIDNNGSISWDEIGEIINVAYNLTSKDSNRPKVNEFTKQLFQDMDTNRDNKVSFDEFLSATKRNEEIIKLLFKEMPTCTD